MNPAFLELPLPALSQILFYSPGLPLPVAPLTNESREARAEHFLTPFFAHLITMVFYYFPFVLVSTLYSYFKLRWFLL